jgi:hypothetical protein
MTGAAGDHKIREAARWLSHQQGEHAGNIINTIRENFSLSAWQACEACRVAQEFRHSQATGAA